MRYKCKLCPSKWAFFNRKTVINHNKEDHGLDLKPTSNEFMKQYSLEIIEVF